MAIVAMSSFQCITFHVNLHPDLVKQLLDSSRDPCAVFRDRLREQLRRAGQPERERLFVIEGYAKDRRTMVRLHVHGAAFVETTADADILKACALRAAGQGIGGRSTRMRAYHSKAYWGGGLRFTDYIFKVIDLPDARLPGRRMAMSQSLTQGAQEFYEFMAFGHDAQNRRRIRRLVTINIP